MWTILLAFSFTILHVQALDFSRSLNDEILSQCDRCIAVVDSFKEGLKRTARGKHEGGDAKWEEAKLRNYAFSEVRFVDIQEHLCEDTKKSKDQCHSFAEDYESEIEHWFLNELKNEPSNQDSGSSLLQYLCHDVAKSCCPDGHFGADCRPCPGHPDNVCNSRGTCNGSGSRTGTGTCKCSLGYGGKHCEKCSKKYFSSGGVVESAMNGQVFSIPEKCQRCDRSCEESCTSAGPKGCRVCAKGYTWDEEFGCADVNECSTLEVNPCTEQKYCVNTIGSYECYRCNSACDRCTGPEDSSCINCAAGYRQIGTTCLKHDAQLSKYFYLLFLIPGLLIFISFNLWYATSFVILCSIIVGYFEDDILLIL